MKLETLKELGTEWKKDDKHRIYFNKVSRFIDGISNSKARKIDAPYGASLYYDVVSGKFYAGGFSDETLKTVIAKIKELAS